MGHPSEIFPTPPPDTCICGICRDVLQDAIAFKECGHTFCNNCALPNKTCPSCRREVTGTVPSYFARDTIGSMQCNCPNKRLKSTSNDAFPGCDWTGKVQDLHQHETECSFETIKCSVNGCSHKCYRRDLDAHLKNNQNRHFSIYDGRIQSQDKALQEMQAKLEEI